MHGSLEDRSDYACPQLHVKPEHFSGRPSERASTMPDSVRRFRQRLFVGIDGATSYGKREGKLADRKVAQVTKGCRCAVLFEDRNPGNERRNCRLWRRMAGWRRRGPLWVADPATVSTRPCLGATGAVGGPSMRCKYHVVPGRRHIDIAHQSTTMASRRSAMEVFASSAPARAGTVAMGYTLNGHVRQRNELRRPGDESRKTGISARRG